jgi:hypothetical protein
MLRVLEERTSRCDETTRLLARELDPTAPSAAFSRTLSEWLFGR